MNTSLKPPFYVISDTHFFHDNIVRYCHRPHDHGVMMMKRWERAVKNSDTILHLGDLFFGGEKGYEKFKTEIAPNLTGKKYIILGNHDKKKWDYAALGFTVLKPFTSRYRGYKVTFSHYPILVEEGEKRIHIHGHIHNHGYALGEMERYGNINCSVEVLDYRPHRVTRLLNKEIVKRNQGRKRYYNSRHFRWNKRENQRRAA